MGSNTTHGYFYKPALGASGATELALFHAKLDIADAQIEANRTGFQPLDTGLTSIAALTTVANKIIYTTALDTYAVAALTAFARTILDDADASTVRTTLSLNNVENTAISTWVGTTNITTLGTIATGIWSATTIAIAKGGTGVTTGAMTGLTSILNTALYIGRDADNQIKFATDNTIVFRLGGSDGAAFISTGELDMNAHSIGFTAQTLTGDGTDDIDWKLGIKMIFTCPAGDETFTFTAPTNPCNLLLHIIQDSVGGRDITFPVTVKWLGTEPTWSDGGADKSIVMSMWYDGTSYWSQGTSWEA